jgi:desulfoferrodoxin (superoxide reductase-like protein)
VLESNRPESPRAPGLSRRRLLGLAAAAVGLLGERRRVGAGPPSRRLSAEDPRALSAFERLHFPAVRLPVMTANGDRVPITIEMSHPMEPGHHITRVTVVNERDPVPLKGVFELTPTSGLAHLAFQARIDEGASEVAVTAECNLHGAWTSTGTVRVADGAGGCSEPAPSKARPASTEILPPRLRLPELVRTGRVRAGDVLEAQLLMRHPNRTGLVRRDGKFVAESAPFHLRELEVFYGEARVSRFLFTSALSDDPLITFRVRAGQGGLLRVLLVNTRGQRFEALARVDVS